MGGMRITNALAVVPPAIPVSTPKHDLFSPLVNRSAFIPAPSPPTRLSTLPHLSAERFCQDPALFRSAAQARAEVMRRDPTREHAIGKFTDLFIVVSGTTNAVTLPWFHYYLHTHAGWALPSSRDLCTFHKQASQTPDYETLIYSTDPTKPGLSHLRSLGGNCFRLTYADGAQPTSPSTPQFFGPVREFEIVIDRPFHQFDQLHRWDYVITIEPLGTDTKVTYRWDSNAAVNDEQWFWGQILAGKSPEEIDQSLAHRNG